jgi:hypothetical protein
MILFVIFTQNAFAAGSASAKAMGDFERANLGVKRRASRVDEVDFTS